MLIDWFTVGAQVLNFVILVWLLKRFLYKPILDAIDAREQQIATKIADADKKNDEAQTERTEYRKKNESLDQQRIELLNNAAAEAKKEGQRLLDQARKSADELRDKQKSALETEWHHLNDEITLRTHQEVFSIAKKTLSDLAGITLEQRIGEVFMRRLRGLDASETKKLVSALSSTQDPVLVHSAFPLCEKLQSDIHQLLKDIVNENVSLTYEVLPALISGIELNANGYKITWSIDGYLRSMGEHISDLLNEHSVPSDDVAPNLLPALKNK